MRAFEIADHLFHGNVLKVFYYPQSVFRGCALSHITLSSPSETIRETKRKTRLVLFTAIILFLIKDLDFRGNKNPHAVSML